MSEHSAAPPLQPAPPDLSDHADVDQDRDELQSERCARLRASGLLFHVTRVVSIELVCSSGNSVAVSEGCAVCCFM